jgi:hypothetical protein
VQVWISKVPFDLKGPCGPKHVKVCQKSSPQRQKNKIMQKKVFKVENDY